MSQDSDEIAVTSATMPSLAKKALEKSPGEDPKIATTTITVPNKPRSPPELSAPPIKKPRLNTEYPNFTRPTIKTEHIHADLAAFGFSREEIKNMLGKEDVLPDPSMPGHLLGAAKAKAQLREKRERVKKNGASGVGMEKVYEPLFLVEGSNWALFDPTKNLPACFGEAPAFFTRYATFQPGNSRILEFNVRNRSVRLRSTPAVLLAPDRKVEYARSGPRIVEAVPPTAAPATTAASNAPKRKRGRPRKYPSPAENEASENGGKVVNGKVKGRPRKSVVSLPESDGSESSLTDLEMDDGDGDWGETVAVKMKVEEREIEDSEVDG